MSPSGAGKRGCPCPGAGWGPRPGPLRGPRAAPARVLPLPGDRSSPTPGRGLGAANGSPRYCPLELTLATSDQSASPSVLKDSASIQWRGEVREGRWGGGNNVELLGGGGGGHGAWIGGRGEAPPLGAGTRAVTANGR